jgi:hypothetical protein
MKNTWIIVGQCIAFACVTAGCASGSEIPDVEAKSEALDAPDPDPVPVPPEERAARERIAKNVDKQTKEEQRAYHKAYAAALRDELKTKRAVLKDVESKRAEVPGGTDRDALDTKLTEMRTSVTKAEQRLADSDAKSN